MRSYFGLIVLLMMLIVAQRATANVWNSWNTVEDAKPLQVIQYLDVNADEHLVVIDGGSEDGLYKDAVFKTYRASTQQGGIYQPEHSTGEPLWVVTGAVKAVEVQPTYTIAMVTEEASDMAKAFFPRFPGVMAGDVAMSHRMALVRKQVLTPERTLNYADLFQDPKAQPFTFELSEEGQEQLLKAAAEFADARVSLLMVEGYTDHQGPTNVNQVESYQRALTVRQFLIDRLGFDEKRVVAIGYGETEQVDASLAPGYVEANRRIVLKAVPVAP